MPVTPRYKPAVQLSTIMPAEKGSPDFFSFYLEKAKAITTMPQGDELLVVYLELARAARRRNRPWDRDKLLLLAGAAAAERGRHRIASLCKREILAHNAGHLIGGYGKLSEALSDERFSRYLTQLRRNYTPERCEHMLASLGIDTDERRGKFADLDEYAAATLSDGAEADSAGGE